MNEFELIRTCFASQPVSRPDVRVGIGDDAAVFRVPGGMETAITSDVLVAGVHFFADADPVSIGHKSLAVNLSDLAAMGAEPAWFLLDLTMPSVDVPWVQRFAEGAFGVARRFNVQLIGGDMSRGPLAIGITAIGLVPEGGAILRSDARPGDQIYVTGDVGDAALSLMQHRGELKLSVAESAAITDRLARPMPRVDEGLALRGIASSAIDLSDGLLADLGHVLEASAVGARLELARVPLSSVYRARLAEIGWEGAIANGDDYELCFTVPPERIPDLERMAAERRFVITRIGEITEDRELDVRDPAGKPYRPRALGHDHFAPA